MKRDYSGLRVLLVYGHDPKTTAVYAYRALVELGVKVETIGPVLPGVEFEHSLGNVAKPDVADAVARMDGCDLVLWIESPGIEGMKNLSKVRVPVAYWAIDVILRHGWRRHAVAARSVSVTYLAQLAYLGIVSQGYSTTAWLPLACDPVVHGPSSVLVPEEFDVAMVGGMDPSLHPDRVRLVERLREEGFSMNVTQCPPEQMSTEYARAKVGLNRSLGGELNMRFFEILCSGRPLLSDHTRGAGQDILFRPSEHYFSYRSDEECVSILRTLSDDPTPRSKVAQAGRSAVLSGHTYKDRMATVLEEAVCLPSPAEMKLRELTRTRLYLGDVRGIGLRKSPVLD